MSAASQVKPSIEIFFSYSHEDEKLRKALDEHLSEVWRRGVARWHDRQIGAGTEWEGQIDDHLDSAQIILLLISKSFLASDYCYDIEMKHALERHERGDAIVIPVLLRPIAWWKRSPFRKLQCLPRESKPVTEWRNQDAALASVAEEIMKIVDRLLGEAEPSEVWPRLAMRSNRSLLRWALAALVLIGVIALGVRERVQWLSLSDWRATNTRVTSDQDNMRTSRATSSQFAVSNFPLTVYVHGSAGQQDLPLRNQGEVLLNLGGDRRRAPIGDKGQAVFRELPANFRGQKINVVLDASGYERANNRHLELDGTSLYMEVRRKPSRIAGNVIDETGKSVVGATVSMSGISATSVEQGCFDLMVPSDRVLNGMVLRVSADGYQTWNQVVIPDGGPVTVVLRR